MKPLIVGLSTICLVAAVSTVAIPALAAAPATAVHTSTVAGLPAAADRGEAERIATRIAQRVPTAVKVTRITQANDANQLLGRPGGYTSGAWIKDNRTESVGTGADTGAAVEVFKNATYAAARVNYINAIQSIGFGHDYTTRIGNVVLRVSEELTPAQARGYETAFASVMR